MVLTFKDLMETIKTIHPALHNDDVRRTDMQFGKSTYWEPKKVSEEYLDEDSDDKFASDAYSTTRAKVVKNKSGVFFATNKSGSTKSFTSEKQANRHAVKEEYPDEENAVDKVTMMETIKTIHPALQKYLKSKGIDPRYVTHNQMIGHSKTGDFNKWKQDHYNKARITHGMESVEIEELDVIEEGDTKSPNKKQQLSKSARLIKSLYKHHGVSEEQDVIVYGKKPKLIDTFGKTKNCDTKPGSGAVLTGGTTLTGEKRDDVEFDPKMQVTNGLTSTISKKTKTTK